mmetsp:Transcript_27981/g.83622  ORF Transcript_27981/g.83622 Transcript_27981/m.83622 type:complete len:241 (-) Transcript_27981:13-735(-)
MPNETSAVCRAGELATAAATAAPTPAPAARAAGAPSSTSAAEQSGCLRMTAARVSARKPISMVSATAMTNPALAPAAEERPMSSPSTPLSTSTATVKATGKAGALRAEIDFSANAILEPSEVRPPPLLRPSGSSALERRSSAAPAPSSSPSGKSLARIRKRATPAAKPLTMPTTLARSAGASLIIGTSSTATAERTMPAARCWKALIITFGTWTTYTSALITSIACQEFTLGYVRKNHIH